MMSPVRKMNGRKDARGERNVVLCRSQVKARGARLLLLVLLVFCEFNKLGNDGLVEPQGGTSDRRVSLPELSLSTAVSKTFFTSDYSKDTFACTQTWLPETFTLLAPRLALQLLAEFEEYPALNRLWP